MSDTTSLQTGHPAPARHRVGPVQLALALGAAPAAWMLQLLFSFSATSYFCRAGQPAAVPGWIGLTVIAVNGAALLAAVAALGLAVRLIRLSREEHQDRSGGVLEVGEGRTRFLASWGAFLSGVFIVAILANSLSLLLVPLCRA